MRFKNSFRFLRTFGALAQSVEQWIENPCVPGSIPGGATTFFSHVKVQSMETLVTVIHVVVALFMILVVLIQSGNSGGVGAAFGGGNASGVFGASGANAFLTKLTYGAAGLFMFTSIGLTVLQRNAAKSGLLEKLEATSGAPADTTPAAPAAAAPVDAGTATPADAPAQN